MSQISIDKTFLIPTLIIGRLVRPAGAGLFQVSEFARADGTVTQIVLVGDLEDVVKGI
jgi:hypothetical protein